MNDSLLFLLIVFGFLLNWSCSKSEDNICDQVDLVPLNGCKDSTLNGLTCEVRYIGYHEYLNSSFEAIPYKEVGKSYVYENEMGEELVLKVDSHLKFIAQINSKYFACDNDLEHVRLCRENLVYSVNLSDSSEKWKFRLRLKTLVMLDSQEEIVLKDELDIAKLNQSNLPQVQFGLDVNERNYPQDYIDLPHNEIFFDSITLIKKTHLKVYSDSLSYYYGDEPLLKYYFNYDIGIIGFEDDEDLWELQSVE